MLQNSTSVAIVNKLDTLIDEVEAQIEAQRSFIGVGALDETALLEMLDTLEQLRAFRERFFATVH